MVDLGMNRTFCISDDRSIELFRTRLETATQMREVLNKDYRPNCLVIDEIDGAPAVRKIALLNDHLFVRWDCLAICSIVGRFS